MMLRRLNQLIFLVFVAAAPIAIAGSLADSPSAFVRAQAASGVKWHAWDEETLALGAKQDKPVYVFVASELSGLTRATINQTFASEKTVEWINENFFCIFVDEDAQPDVGAYAQHYINSVKQMRGSPVHFWLTPDMQPFDGANYLPPSEEWGRPGFLKSARSALDTFHTGPLRVKALSEEALSMMRLTPVNSDGSDDATARLDSATKAWIAAADKVNGGFGGAPKNPEPELIVFLLMRGGEAQEVAIAAVRAIVSGELRDPIDGGFYRRCIDEAWKEPYLQKTLLDQARIAPVLPFSRKNESDESLREAAIGALDYVLREMRNPDGSFSVALDATSDTEADSGRRPKFVRVGRATTESLGWLVGALESVGEDRFRAAAAEIKGKLRACVGEKMELPHIIGVSPHGTPADYLAVAAALDEPEDRELVRRLVEHANTAFFDSATGHYMATPSELPPGIACRVPAKADPIPAEVLGLLAGVDAATAKLLRLGLLGAIEYDELPPGEVLLALSKGQE